MFTSFLLIRFWKGNFFGDPCGLFSLDTLCVLKIVVINDFFSHKHETLDDYIVLTQKR